MEKDKTIKKVLVVNDDGISAPGLKALVRMLIQLSKKSTKYEFHIRVVAPASEQSAKSHSISVHELIKAKKYVFEEEDLKYVEAVAVYGTPADCTRLGIFKNVLMGSFQPDIVLSGINKGNNAGLNVVYSGTVSAAVEATLLGFNAAALSLDYPPSYPSSEDIWPYDASAQLAEPIIIELLEKKLPHGITLNINFPNLEPPGRVLGVRIARQGESTFEEEFEHVSTTDDVLSFRLIGVMKINDDLDDFDTVCLKQGWITVTPLGLFTDVLRPVTSIEMSSWKSCNHIFPQ